MTFLHPEFLYLGFLLLPLGLLYLLKVRPRRRITTTLFLWEQVLSERKSSALFRRFRDLLSLLMLAIAMIAAILGLAGPVLKDRERITSLIVVIDNSTASGAKSVDGSTLLEKSRSAAEKIIRHADDDCLITLSTAAGNLRTIVNSTGNRSKLFSALQDIQATGTDFSDTSLNGLRDAVRTIGLNGRAVIITGSNLKQPSGMSIVDVGKAAPNVAITGCDVQHLPGQDDSALFWFQTASSFKKEIKATLLLCNEHENNIIRARPVTIKPGVNPPERFSVKYAAAGRWIMRLELTDALAKDNYAYAILRRRPPLKVGFSSKNANFFQLCIEAFRNSKLQTVPNVKEPELILMTGNPVGIKCENILIFAPRGKSPFWKKAGPVMPDAQPVKMLLPEHPGVRFCKLDDLQLKGVCKLTPPDGAIITAVTQQGTPLIYRVKVGRQQVWVYNFDPAESEFFLNLNFPLLIASATADLSGRTDLPPASFKTGMVLPEPLVKKFTGEKMILPDQQQLKIAPGMPPEFAEPGFYRIGQTDFAASLLSRKTAMKSGETVKRENFQIKAGLPLSFLLICLAIVLIASESILYHRRKAG
jgi:Aerotolerance regulator N-terminal